jgi:hypothetical protein
MDVALDFGDGAGTPGDFQIIKILEVKPEFRVGVEVAGESKRGGGGDAAALVHNFTDARGSHV